MHGDPISYLLLADEFYALVKSLKLSKEEEIEILRKADLYWLFESDFEKKHEEPKLYTRKLLYDALRVIPLDQQLKVQYEFIRLLHEAKEKPSGGACNGEEINPKQPIYDAIRKSQISFGNLNELIYQYLNERK